MVGDSLGGSFAAAIQRTFMVAQSGIVPGRFCMSQEENCLHWHCPGKRFENKYLVNCHDTVM